MKSIQFYEKLQRIPRSKKLSLKRNHRQCKRNGNKPHEYVVIKLDGHKHWRNWIDLSCRHCGKREYLFDGIFGTGYWEKKLKELNKKARVMETIPPPKR